MMIPTVDTICRPWMQSARPAAKAEPHTVIRRHPRGGWTHAVLLSPHGTARVYVGQWRTARLAALALN